MPRVCTFFNSRKCQKGDACTFSHPKQTCKFWQRGNCDKGEHCRFLHPTVPCKFFAKGTCEKGLECPFRHVRVPPPSAGPTKRIVFIVTIDTSGSMAGSNINVALKCLGHIVTKVLPKDETFYGCYIFNSESSRLHDPQLLSSVNWAADHHRILENVGGRTALYDAICDSSGEMMRFARYSQEQAERRGEEHPELLFHHIVITDGEDVSSQKTLDDARAAIAHPGIGNYNLSLLGIGLNQETKAKMDLLCEPVHAHLLSAANLDGFKEHFFQTYNEIVRVVAEYRGRSVEAKLTKEQFKAMLTVTEALDAPFARMSLT